jgi:hypothetical protein
VTGGVPDSERDLEFDLAVVGFSEGGFGLFSYRPGQDDHLGEYIGDLNSCCANHSISVIGNTHQHPHLLTETPPST